MKTITEQPLITLMRGVSTLIETHEALRAAETAVDDAQADHDASKFALMEMLSTLELDAEKFVQSLQWAKEL